MKKIALVFLGDHSYDARCINMINSLAKKNHLLSIYSTGKTKNSLFNNHKINEYNVSFYSIPFIKYFFWLFRVYCLLRQESYDIVIAADIYSLIPTCLLSKKVSIIYDSREIYTKLSVHFNRPITNWLIYCFEKSCIKRTDKIIVTAPSDQQYLQKKYNLCSLPFCTIYNFPSSSFVFQKSSFLKDKLNIPKNTTLLLYQGVIQKNRGLLQLIKIIKKTKKTAGVIIGTGSYVKVLNKHIEKNNLQDRFFILSAVPYHKLLQITSSADIGVSLVRPVGLSNLYALPNKLFEYALSGLPTLASDIPNIKKYVNKYHLGWCVNDTDLFSQIKIIKNYQSRGFSLSAFNSYKNLFSWESQERAFNGFVLDE